MIRYDQPPLPIKYSLSVNALSESVGLWKLPEEWKWHTLKDIASASAEQIRPGDYPNEIFNFWGLDSIESGQWQEPLPNLVEGRTIKSNCIKFDQSHVLYAKLRPYLNKVIVPSIAGIGSTEWVPLKPAPKIIDRKFLAFYLRTPSFVVYANRNSTGARMPRVRMSSLWEAPVPIPYPDNPIRSLAEQRRIVARIETLLSEVRETRKINEAIIEDTKQLMDAFIQEVMDHPGDNWKTAQLSDVAQVQTGTAKGRRFGNRKTVELPYLRVANVQAGYLNLDEIKTIQIAEDEIERYKLQSGDLLLTEGGDFDKLGRGAIWRDEIALCIHQNHVFAVRFNQSEVLPEFAEYEMQSQYAKTYFLSVAKRTTNLASINKIQLSAFPIRYPSKKEQYYIVKYLDTVKAEIKAMQEIQARDEQVLAQVEQAILTQAFRGEL